jgi:hypothetical protein
LLSKVEANEKLRWFLREILYADTWVLHPYNKVIVGLDVIDSLEFEGFFWQADRVKNHLHRWMRSIACKDPEILDTPREEEDLLA